MSLLENMQTFLRVVDLGGMSAAARQLRLSPAVVSHRLQQLEAHLGVRLLNRNTRSLQLTDPGSAFYEACQDVLRAVEHAEGVAFEASGNPVGNIRLSAPLGLGRRMLAPLVPRFCALHPRLSIRLRLSDHLLDLLREAVDLSVRIAVPDHSSLVARKIADCPAHPLRRSFLSRNARDTADPRRPVPPRVPAAAVSGLATIPLDAADALRPGDLARPRPARCR
jgi:DNA-binding transcriptional LysR family regulator